MSELTAGDTVEIVGGSYKSKGTATVQHVTAAKVKVKFSDGGEAATDASVALPQGRELPWAQLGVSQAGLRQGF